MQALDTKMISSLKDEYLFPSKNRCSFSTKAHFTPSIKMAQIIERRGFIPITHPLQPKKRDLCLSISLDFLRRYKHNGKFSSAPVSIKCAKRSAIYFEILKNTHVKTNEERDLKLLQAMNVVIDSFHFKCEAFLKLDLEVDELIDFIKKKLNEGTYLFCLPGHVTALIKNKDGLYFFDPNKGLANLYQLNFKRLLQQYKAHLADSVEILKLTDEEMVSTKYEMIESPAPIIIEKSLNESFQFFLFKWRGKEIELLKEIRTGDIYNNDSEFLLRVKCAFLIVLIPIICLAKIIHSLFMSIIHLSRPLDCFRSVIYGVACEAVAIYGLINPFKARNLYTKLNREVKFYPTPWLIPINYKANNSLDSIKYIKRLIR